MAQCDGRNQRTGERCKRTAPLGTTTCSYHDPTASEARRAAAARRASDLAAIPPGTSFTTKELSKQTFDDFETLFAQGTGWGRCGCLFALDATRSTRGGTWAAQRDANLCTMRDLVERGRSQGILVYDGKTPMGWCQVVPKDQVRNVNAADSEAAWFVTCFVIEPRYRGLGATGVALRAVLDAIGRRGGGIVEAYATAIAPGPPPEPDRRGAYVDGDVVFFGGSAKVRFRVEIEGVGPVIALYRSKRSMHSAPLGGTVDLFRREGFRPVGVLPRPTSGQAASIQPDRIVMRRTVHP